MRHRIVVIAALIAAAPGPAAAQFTTVVVPPRRPDPLPKSAAAPPATARDSAERSRLELSSMKAWVDSAAAAIERSTVDSFPPVPEDSTQELPSDERTSASRAAPIPAGEETLAFSNGAPAPNTATSLPAIALLGLGSLGAGVLLIWASRA
ncbi:MAG: hypothetical protein ACRENI_13535 [Gemmatimonadaceae bacterium]